MHGHVHQRHDEEGIEKERHRLQEQHDKLIVDKQAETEVLKNAHQQQLEGQQAESRELMAQQSLNLSYNENQRNPRASQQELR